MLFAARKMLLKKPGIIACALALVFAAGFLFVGGGCAKKEEQLRLFAAAGLKKPMDEVISLFEKETGVKVVPNYGASGGLYAQIKEGQPCDLFYSADWLYIEKVGADGKLAEAQKFLRDKVVLVVSKTGRNKVKNVQDLARPGVTVGVCDPNAPVGAYAENALRKMNIWNGINAAGNLKARPSTVNQLAIMVQQDQLDAGLVFSSVANGYGLEKVQVLPEEYTGEVVFGAAVIKGGNEKLAKKFMEVAGKNVDKFAAYGWEAY
jgi:molybdate transport system substrate-binding protein